MMHYATVTDGYDIGALISGDKDFMPAMSRVKQKGKRMVSPCSLHMCLHAPVYVSACSCILL